MKCNCTIQKKYLRRIESFFTFFDENNNERLYKELIKGRDLEYKNPIANHSYSIISFIIFLFLKGINYMYIFISSYTEK